MGVSDEVGEELTRQYIPSYVARYIPIFPFNIRNKF
jgi:hypothetical protein